ncbi:MAG: hypothetical protein AAF937_08660 [Planctomycetota bacterium]
MPIRRGGVLKPMLIAVLVIVAVGVLWLCVEIYFALTATPNIDTDYASQMEELAASVQSEGEKRWAEYSSILADHKLTLLAIEASIPGFDGAEALLYDPSVIYDASSWIEDVENEDGISIGKSADEKLAEFEAAAAAYRAGFDGASLQGAADRLRALRVAEAVVVRPIPRDGMLIDVMPLTQFTESRPLAKSIRAKMFLAAQRDDWAEYVETVADGLWLSRTTAAESLLINGLVGLGIHQIVIDGVRQQVLGGRVPAPALGELGELLASAPIPNAAHALRGELIWGLDAVQHTHDARGRFMRSRLPLLEGMDETSPAIVNLASVVMPRRATTERAFRDYFDVIIERSAMTPAERRASASEPFPNEVSGNPLLKLMSPALGLVLRSFDSAHVDRVGVQIMVAIERYRAEHDELPASLAELVPALLDELPSDPWAADAPLVYKLDDSDLGYTLYTVGFDGVDNGGTPAERAYDAFAPDADGTDFVFTAPGR